MKKLQKPTIETVRTLSLDFVAWTIGSFLFAVSVQCFITPQHFAAGGLTGIATLVNYLFPQVSSGLVIIVLNIPLFIIAWKKLGLTFIIRTVIATAISSLFIDLTARYFPAYEGDKLLCAIFGGALCGLGLGIVFRRGATTGGVDILARLLRFKLPHIATGTLEMICDGVVVLLAGLVYKSVDSILYSMLIIFLSSRAINYVIIGMSNGKMMLILTGSYNEVTTDIMTETGRGVSIIPVQGGWTKAEKKMLMTVVRPNEVDRIRKIVKRYDNMPFIIITDSTEVLGKGFKDHNETLG